MGVMAFPHTAGRFGKRERVGWAEFDCPEECSGTVDTHNAMAEEQIENGLRWTGCPCSGCDKTYTVEMVDTEEDPQ